MPCTLKRSGGLLVENCQCPAAEVEGVAGDAIGVGHHREHGDAQHIAGLAVVSPKAAASGRPRRERKYATLPPIWLARGPTSDDAAGAQIRALSEIAAIANAPSAIDASATAR